MTTDATLSELLETLISEGRLAVAAWPMELGTPEDLGLLTRGDSIFLRPNAELLSPSHIHTSLSKRAARWLSSLEVLRVIGSTNDRLMLLAETESVDGVVCIAELQTKGRGRRGRTWFSPFAGSLALSLGVALDRAVHDLGGLSLVVGLAVLDCLRDLGVADLALKWPNDIFLGGRKLGGILVELKSQPGASAARVEAVIGIGLNVDVPATVRGAIDQAVTDLVAEGYVVSRNVLAGRLVSSLVDYVKEFERVGFAPMCDLFNDHHLLHRRTCEIAQGEGVVVGRVAGVTEVGEILLETDSGTLAFAAGEVSLRRQD